ncbi:TetR/AcrR family transcriptional regulator [Actinomadura logoneensis]|uniref:TetR/AcrR family transcriptional regulator n=1 Tax=Actinomadura logoneensis TaxID=2293572 RepID=A0A372JLD9_9ACTN|nr:TetR/AcrR family transcriptional regulator [Actinomadura logoneensis]RFU40831.1 TetR/AcrR family transcriptional regulator [Actinomadura logoneensis]
MPTGVAIRDPRQHLFDAAERVLLAAGPNALTSRAVTAEADVAKGVLHRHFADFDAFLAELVEDRTRRVEADRAALVAAAGTGEVVGNLTAAITALFSPVAVAMVALVTSRDGLRARLRAAGLPGLPVLTQGTAMIAEYLEAERAAGRVAPGASADTLALMLVGSAHMHFTSGDGGDATLREIVATTVTLTG